MVSQHFYQSLVNFVYDTLFPFENVGNSKNSHPRIQVFFLFLDLGSLQGSFITNRFLIKKSASMIFFSILFDSFHILVFYKKLAWV